MFELPNNLFGDSFDSDPVYFFKLVSDDNVINLCSTNYSIYSDLTRFDPSCILENLITLRDGGLGGTITIHDYNEEFSDFFNTEKDINLDIWISEGRGYITEFNSSNLYHRFSGILEKINEKGNEIKAQITTEGRLRLFSPPLLIQDVFQFYTRKNTQLDWGCERQLVEEDLGLKPIPIYIGEKRNNGIPFFHVVDGLDLLVSVCWCLGATDVSDRIESLSDFKIGGDDIDENLISHTDYLGTINQNVNTDLQNVVSGYSDTGNIDFMGTQIGVAYSVFRFPKDSTEGLPTFDVLTKGLRLEV